MRAGGKKTVPRNEVRTLYVGGTRTAVDVKYHKRWRKRGRGEQVEKRKAR